MYTIVMSVVSLGVKYARFHFLFSNGVKQDGFISPVVVKCAGRRVAWQQREGANRDVSVRLQRQNPTEAGIAVRYTVTRGDAEGVTPDEAKNLYLVSNEIGRTGVQHRLSRHTNQ